jgi:hypothetical protein
LRLSVSLLVSSIEIARWRSGQTLVFFSGEKTVTTLVKAAIRSPFKVFALCMIGSLVINAPGILVFLAMVGFFWYTSKGRSVPASRAADVPEQTRAASETPQAHGKPADPVPTKPAAPQYAKSAVVIPIRTPKEQSAKQQASI